MDMYAATCRISERIDIKRKHYPRPCFALCYCDISLPFPDHSFKLLHKCILGIFIPSLYNNFELQDAARETTGEQDDVMGLADEVRAAATYHH